MASTPLDANARALHPLPVPDRALIAADAQRAAALWQACAERTREARYTRMLDAEVAQLLMLSPDRAWQELSRRGRNGDVKAATGALLVANECEALSSWRSPPYSERFLDKNTRKLPTDWSGFLHAIGAREHARYAGRIAHCAGVGGVMDFALLALDRFIRPDDPETQLAAVHDIADDTTAITDLRKLADQLDDDAARMALAERLIESNNAANQAEGLGLLQSLAATEPDAVDYLASCLHSGCGYFRKDPGAGAAWLERAAGLGGLWALDTLIGDLQASGQPTDALAWALYRLDLASAGCYPDLGYLLQSANSVFSLESSLDASRQTQAGNAKQAIETQWSAPAMTRLGCAG